MPPSTAALTIGSAAVSSRTHGRSLSFPKLIMPRHTLDTLRPVRPRFVYLIATSSLSPTWRPYRHGYRSESAGAAAPRLDGHGALPRDGFEPVTEPSQCGVIARSRAIQP